MFLLPVGPLLYCRRDRVAIGTHITQSDRVQNWLKPDFLISAAHECMCMCVCSCICVHMCVRLRSTCFVPCHGYLLLLPDHIYAPVSSEITFSYFQSRGDSGHCLPPSCLLWPGAGVDTGLHPDHRAYWHFWWNYWIRAVFIASGDADLVQYKPGIAGHRLFTTRRWPI